MEQDIIELEEMNDDVLRGIVDQLDNTEDLSDEKYALKELLSGGKQDIKFKTDLNLKQIQGIVQLLTADRIMKAQSEEDSDKAKELLESVPEHMTHLLMMLLVSRDRKGRSEFLSAIHGQKTQKQGGGWFDKWINRGQD